MVLCRSRHTSRRRPGPVAAAPTDVSLCSEDVWVQGNPRHPQGAAGPYIVSLQPGASGLTAGKFSNEIPFSPWNRFDAVAEDRLPEAKEVDVVAVNGLCAGPALDPSAPSPPIARCGRARCCSHRDPGRGQQGTPSSSARIKENSPQSGQGPRWAAFCSMR